MSVKQVDRQRPDWQGLSTDDMPMAAGDGVKYHEVDTGRVWVMHDGAWTEDLRLQYAIEAASLA